MVLEPITVIQPLKASRPLASINSPASFCVYSEGSTLPHPSASSSPQNCFKYLLLMWMDIFASLYNHTLFWINFQFVIRPGLGG